MRKNGWNQSEIDFLVNNAGLLTDEQIAEQLSQITGRKITRAACTQRRSKLGLKKTRGRKSKLVRNDGGQSEPAVSLPSKTEQSDLVTAGVEQESNNVGHAEF